MKSASATYRALFQDGIQFDGAPSPDKGWKFATQHEDAQGLWIGKNGVDFDAWAVNTPGAIFTLNRLVSI